MNKMILWMQVSADGYAAAADGAFDWPVITDETQEYFLAELAKMGTFAYGTNVYGWMSSCWPNVEHIPGAGRLDIAYGELWVPMPKVVFSRSLDHADRNTTIASGDLATEVAAAKQRSEADIAVFGGPTIAQALIERQLIDEFRLFVHPVLLGDGHKLFPTLDTRRNLRLVESRALEGGVIYVHWATE